MINNEILHKEIDLIQACINRMANNSFLLKGWCVSLILAVLALSKEQLIFSNGWFVFIPIVLFWGLDTYFLRLERMYRKLYQWVIGNRPKGNVEYLYDLNAYRFKHDVENFLCVFFSKSLLMFYMGILLSVLFFICC